MVAAVETREEVVRVTDAVGNLGLADEPRRAATLPNGSPEFVLDAVIGSHDEVSEGLAVANGGGLPTSIRRARHRGRRGSP